MILKESKLYRTFSHFLKNIVKEKMDDILIGLELELQTNNMKQEQLFSYISDPDDIELSLEDFDLKMVHEKKEVESKTRSEIIDFIENIYDYSDSIESPYGNEDLSVVQEQDHAIDDSQEKMVFLKIVHSLENNKNYFVEIRVDKLRGTEEKRVYELDEQEYQKYKNTMDMDLEQYRDVGNEDIEIKFLETFYYDGKWKIKELENPYLNDEGFEESLINHYFNGSDKLEKFFKNYGLYFHGSYHDDTSENYFLMEPDSSLHPNEGLNTKFELKTPYGFTLKEQLKFFKQFLNNESKQKFGLKPNKSCGLHVNVSLKGQKSLPNLNYVILYELFNENKYKINTRMSNNKGVKNIENFDVHYQKLIKKQLKEIIIGEMRRKKFDINDRENVEKLINNIQELLHETVLDDEKSDDEKYRSFLTKDDRIEFRIMGNDYLKKDTMKYILEMQGIYYQQVTQPEDLKIECEVRFIKKIINEIKKKNTHIDKDFEKKNFINKHNKYIDMINDQIKKGKFKVESSIQLREIVKQFTESFVREYNKLYKENKKINVYNDWFKSQETLLQKMSEFRSFLTKIELTTMKGLGKKENLNEMVKDIYTKQENLKKQIEDGTFNKEKDITKYKNIIKRYNIVKKLHYKDNTKIEEIDKSKIDLKDEDEIIQVLNTITNNINELKNNDVEKIMDI